MSLRVRRDFAFFRTVSQADMPARPSGERQSAYILSFPPVVVHPTFRFICPHFLMFCSCAAHPGGAVDSNEVFIINKKGAERKKPDSLSLWEISYTSLTVVSSTAASVFFFLVSSSPATSAVKGATVTRPKLPTRVSSISAATYL